MKLFSNDTPHERAAKHYRNLMRQEQRQRRWRKLFELRFALLDMIVCALLAAMASAAFTFLLLTR